MPTLTARANEAIENLYRIREAEKQIDGIHVSVDNQGLGMNGPERTSLMEALKTYRERLEYIIEQEVK